jgi:protein Mpv17
MHLTPQAYLPTLLRGYAVFVPAQLVNFALVPPHLQFAAVGAVRVLWSASRAT